MNDVKIEGGYIIQPRKIDGSDIMKLPPIVRELWSYIIRNVNWKDGSYKRGTGFFRFEEIQNDLCWYIGYRKMKYSKPQISKALRKLCEGNAMETMKATRGIIITVLNYNYYQDKKNYEGNGEEITKELRRKHSYNSKRRKEEKKEITDGNKKKKSLIKRKKNLIKTKLTENFPLTNKLKEYAIEKGIPEKDVLNLFGAFKNNHIGKGTLWEKWDRAWYNWVRNEIKWNYRPIKSTSKIGKSLIPKTNRREDNSFDEKEEKQYNN